MVAFCLIMTERRFLRETELVKVDGRALTFTVKAFDEAGLIGEGEHERFVVFNDKFQAKADAKLQK